jgi:hypothetical protein
MNNKGHPIIPLAKDMELDAATVSISQEVDSCGRAADMCNELEIKTQNAGGGHYIVLKTKRWAIDDSDVDAFAAMLKEFMRRVNYGRKD